MPSRMLVPRDVMKGHPKTVEDYLALATAKADAAGRRLVEDDRPVVPCVNGGRWVFRCHHCEAYSPLDPEWAAAACFGTGCHRVYRLIVLPERPERLALEAELEKRPLLRQHWGFERAHKRDPDGPTETVKVLTDERENKTDVSIEPRKDKTP